mmetsp:Transcript_103458/g.194625  ORF Transcript_103458/g.194625 Transcript_103458/m.194625 type:complete len:246 (+) Transcript_103458:32-769(+)
MASMQFREIVGQLAAQLSEQLIEEHEREVSMLHTEVSRLRSELSRVAELARSSLVRESQLQDQLEQATQAQAADAQAAYVQHAQAVAHAQATAQAHVAQAQQRAQLMKDAVNQLSYSLQTLTVNQTPQRPQEPGHMPMPASVSFGPHGPPTHRHPPQGQQQQQQLMPPFFDDPSRPGPPSGMPTGPGPSSAHIPLPPVNPQAMFGQAGTYGGGPEMGPGSSSTANLGSSGMPPSGPMGMQQGFAS